MSDVIGRGVIEVVADSSKLNATIADARARLKGLGDAGKDSAAKASASIDRYVRGLQTQAATLGKTTRETEIYKLALKGASDEQLRSANLALRSAEQYDKHQKTLAKVKTAMLGIAVAAGAMAVAGYHGFQELIKGAGDFQDMAEKTGDSAENLASLFVSAKVGGVEMDGVTDAIVKLNKNLAGLEMDSGAAGKALEALGLNAREIKSMSGADQLETIGKALNSFEDSAAKSTVAIALFGKTGAQMLPFLKELGQEGGRQKILTEEQIKAADDYSDAQTKMRAELTLHAQAIATKLLPAITAFTGALADLAKNETFVSGLTSVLSGGLAALSFVFKPLAVLATEVAFKFRIIGLALEALKEQGVALKNLDFSKAITIGKDLDKRIEAEKKKVEAFKDEIWHMGDKKPDAKPAAAPAAPDAPAPKKKTLKYTYDPKFAETAKARAELDVEVIKRASDGVLNTFQNADRLLAARRAASLIDEQDYYNSKAALIQLDAAEQKRALQAEIDRYSKVKLPGKEGLAIQKKIVEARAELAKVDENAAVAAELNAIEQAAALRRVKDAYDDAAESAKNYLDQIARQSARDFAGAGQGKKFREQQDAAAAIEERLTARKAELAQSLRHKEITQQQYTDYLALAQDTYAKEVDAFTKRTANIEANQADGFKGMTEALHNYADAAKDVSGMVEQAFTDSLSGLENSLVEFATTGKGTFKDLLQSIQADIVRMGFRSLIGGAIDSILPGGLGGLFKGGGGQSAEAARTAALTASTSALAANNAAIAALTDGASHAAAALGGIQSGGDSGQSPAASDAAKAQIEASDSANQFGAEATNAALDVAKLASAASAGGSAMGQIPSIIALIQSAAAAMSASGNASGGGIFGALSSLFGGGGSTADSTGAIEAGLFHAGGIVGQSSAKRIAPLSAFAGAKRYHMGGLIGAAARAITGARLGANEVPAVLMGGPKGRREEVLRADDPRHRDNPAFGLIRRIMEESRNSAFAKLAGARALGGPVSAGGLYQVNERGPELLSVAGKQYLMMGQQGGAVSPTPRPSGGDVMISVSVAPPAGASRATALQFGAAAGRQIQAAMRRNG